MSALNRRSRQRNKLPIPSRLPQAAATAISSTTFVLSNSTSSPRVIASRERAAAHAASHQRLCRAPKVKRQALGPTLTWGPGGRATPKAPAKGRIPSGTSTVLAWKHEHDAMENIQPAQKRLAMSSASSEMLSLLSSPPFPFPFLALFVHQISQVVDLELQL